MNEQSALRADEWRSNWQMVLTAFVGLSLTSVAIYSTGLVIKPIGDEFGWNRTQITAGFTLAMLLAVPLSPLVGALIDRWGVRRLALPGTLLTGLVLTSIGYANGSFAQWLALWFIYGIVVLMIKATIWTAAVSSAFTAGRSMALSVTLCGSAFSGIVVPPLMQYLTDNIGWREAYLIMALVWSIPAFVLSYFFLSDARDRDRLRRKGNPDLPPESPKPQLEGLSTREALRSLALWRIGLSTLIMLLLSTGLLIHKVPLLTEFGITRSNAALLASLSGIAGIVGKIVTGWMMERYDAGWVAGFTNAVTAVALIFLLDPIRSPTTIVISMIVVGYAGGTKLQICVYLTGIYAGLRNYGKIFGAMASIIAVAGALGPLLAGIAYDLNGGYGLFIAAAIPASLLCTVLIVGLGEYPAWSKSLAV